MPAKLQPMGYRRTIQEEYAKPKSQKVEFIPLQMLAIIQTKASGAKQPLFASI
jgi:hypothetical protein